MIVTHQYSDRSDASAAKSESPVDTASLAKMLRSAVPAMPKSYVAGKTALRNATVDALHCSLAKAEELVDQIEAEGKVQFRQRRRGPLLETYWGWTIRS